MRKILAAVVIATLALIGSAGAAFATQPNPEHKVTICHATPPDTAAQGWQSINVDVASVGYQHSGHEDQHDADVIPPYSYTDVDNVVHSYAGKGDQAVLANGCKSLTPPNYHLQPVWTCDTLEFDPPVALRVTIWTTIDGVETSHTATYTPNSDGKITVPIRTWTDGHVVTVQGELPDVFPGVRTAAVTLDCRQGNVLNGHMDCSGYGFDWADFPEKNLTIASRVDYSDGTSSAVAYDETGGASAGTVQHALDSTGHEGDTALYEAWLTDPGWANFHLSGQTFTLGCVPPPVDVCKNIEGNQGETPPGYFNNDGDCQPYDCANDNEFCGQVTVTPTCSGWTVDWVNFSDDRDIRTGNGSEVHVVHTNGRQGSEDVKAKPVEGDKTVTVSAEWTDSGDSPQRAEGSADLHCPTTPPVTTPPTTAPPTELVPPAAVVKPAPQLPGALAYTGLNALTLSGLAAVGILTGLLLLGFFRKGIFARKTSVA